MARWGSMVVNLNGEFEPHGRVLHNRGKLTESSLRQLAPARSRRWVVDMPTLELASVKLEAGHQQVLR